LPAERRLPRDEGLLRTSTQTPDRDHDSQTRRKALPVPAEGSRWATQTKHRLVVRSKVETSPEIERVVARMVARAKEGDSDAVRFLYLRYADNVYGYVRSIVRDHHDAEDVTQQVFAKLITAIARYEQRSVPFVAWLLRMSHNVAVDTIRARRSTPAAEIFGHDVVCDDASERARSLLAAFAALPEDQRQVVVLRHVLGLSPVEIAEQLGRTSSSVYGLHHRGRRTMCAELQRLGSTPLTAVQGQAAVAAAA
jgi:RNA polymerase sigma-70 factor (ECF subfamily)